MEGGKPTHFTVYTKGAGKAPLDVQFSGPSRGPPEIQDFEIINNYDYSYTVKYTPVQQVLSFPCVFHTTYINRMYIYICDISVFVYGQGEMVIIVTFGGDPISKSPFAVGVAAPLDLSKIEVDGLESSEFSYWHTRGFVVFH